MKHQIGMGLLVCFGSVSAMAQESGDKFLPQNSVHRPKVFLNKAPQTKSIAGISLEGGNISLKFVAKPNQEPECSLKNGVALSILGHVEASITRGTRVDKEYHIGVARANPGDNSTCESLAKTALSELLPKIQKSSKNS